jgi:hypothetical protein
LVKDDNYDLLADSHNILNRWKNYLCQLLNKHGVNVLQTEKRTAKLLVPEPSSFEDEVGTEMLKRCKYPRTDQIPVEVKQAGGNMF